MNIYIAAISGLVVIVMGMVVYILSLRRVFKGIVGGSRYIRKKRMKSAHEHKQKSQRYERLVKNTATLKKDYFDLRELYKKAMAREGLEAK